MIFHGMLSKEKTTRRKNFHKINTKEKEMASELLLHSNGNFKSYLDSIVKSLDTWENIRKHLHAQKTFFINFILNNTTSI